MIGIVGDVHGDFEGLNNLMKRYPNIINEWVQVGDFGGRGISYVDTFAPLNFIKGNHENFDQVALMQTHNWPNTVMHIDNGSIAKINGLTFGGIGGNYSPKFFDLRREELHQDRRRHFVQEDFDDIRSWVSEGFPLDILLTHEAPSPYIKKWYDEDKDMGHQVITDLILDINPKLHFFGHHHKFTVSKIGDTISIGLGRSCDEFVILCEKTLDILIIDKDKNIHRLNGDRIIRK